MTRLPAQQRLLEVPSRAAQSGPRQMLRPWRHSRGALRGRSNRIFVAAAAFGAIATVAASVVAMVVSAAAGSNSPDDSARLTNLVRQDCGSCHGLTLNGGLGKPLTADALDHWDHEQLTAIILDGVPGTPMPPWRPLLSEPEARWIADRLKRGEIR